MAQMDEDRLRAIFAAEARGAVGSSTGASEDGIQAERETAMDYYLGKPFGNEVDGESQVIMTEVAEVIDQSMPGLLEPFVAGENVGEYQPIGPEDEEQAKQATDYVNQIVLRVDNPGFRIFDDWFMDAVLQKTGIVKVYPKKVDIKQKKLLQGLSDDEVAQLLQDPEVEALQHTERQIVIGDMPLTLHDILVQRTRSEVRIKIDPVPPEEFLITRRSARIETARFVAHKTSKTVSELIEAGYERKVVEDAASGDAENEWDTEKLARFGGSDEAPMDDSVIDESQKKVWVHDAYMRIDFDGDGVAELRHIVTAGPGYVILENEEVDDDPFCDLCPNPIPHRFFGLSIADKVMDLQLIGSTLMRQLLNNIYNVNNARTAINERVDMDDMLTKRVAGVVRVSGNDAVGDAIHEMATQPIAQHVLPALEHLANVKEKRTGITAYNQGTDSESLNKTATGINAIMSAAAQRPQLIARRFAETGVTKLFRKILKLLIEHQDKERMIRLRNQWVKIDPRSWNADMDVRIAVGLGHGGSKQQKAQAAMGVLQIQEKIALGGGAGTLVTPDNVFNAATDFAMSTGGNIPGRYFTDPKEAPQQQPKPDPKMIEAQQKGEIAKQEFQHKSQLADAELQHKTQLAEREMGMKAQAQQFDMLMKAWMAEQENNRAHAQLQQDGDIKRAGMQQEIGMKREGMQAEQGMKAEAHGFDMGQKRIAAGEEVSDHDPFKALMQQMEAHTQVLVAMVQGITDSNQALVAAIQQPKKILRDTAGKPIGIAPANGAMH
jgi:hypothetical protein